MLDLEERARRLDLYRAKGLIEVHEEDGFRCVLGYNVPLASDPAPKSGQGQELFASSVHPLDLIDSPPSISDEQE